jgi:CheY-like chemotaxis protein/HPt (histidine-containing phosphotransfer) domain-containing protein
MNRDVAGFFLRAAGHRVVCVAGGGEAILAVRGSEFDIVLMDVRMPGMDGLETTRRIRALGGERGRVPIIALTARTFPEQMAECLQAGMDSHLPKPFNPETLLAAVLRAHAAGRVYGQNFGPEPIPIIPPWAPVLPFIGSNQQVLNLTVFGKTVSHLTPAAVASYLDSIAERAEALLYRLQGPDALLYDEDELAEAAHTIAGSAGLLGFERLTVVACHFERAIATGTTEALALVEELRGALEVTVQAIHHGVDR